MTINEPTPSVTMNSHRSVEGKLIEDENMLLMQHSERSKKEDSLISPLNDLLSFQKKKRSQEVESPTKVEKQILIRKLTLNGDKDFDRRNSMSEKSCVESNSLSFAKWKENLDKI